MKIINHDENGITFDNGAVLTAHHDEDFVEYGIVDFENLVAMIDGEPVEVQISELEFSEDLLESVTCIAKTGFTMATSQGVEVGINCYDPYADEDNNELTLIYKNNDKGLYVTMDITECMAE